MFLIDLSKKIVNLLARPSSPIWHRSWKKFKKSINKKLMYRFNSNKHYIPIESILSVLFALRPLDMWERSLLVNGKLYNSSELSWTDICKHSFKQRHSLLILSLLRMDGSFLSFANPFINLFVSIISNMTFIGLKFQLQNKIIKI